MNPKALDQFLAGIEGRAFRIAMLSVNNQATALDLVQEAMLKLAEKYAGNPPEDWPLLFHRILHNAILDHHRRQKVRRAWVSLLGDLVPQSDENDASPIEDTIFDLADRPEHEPEAQLQSKQVLERIDQALADLPLRQRQAFVLRYWEDMDISQTAQVMGCSEGSVKTHCSRAMKALSDALADIRPERQR
jgi:RNA polymerase sigma-70 factor (ECF subfamily)